ncbi:MAG: DUF3526 domain-containing protein [Balneolaceae bacterium]|nr:MAG: DUF3526 domain-containing protein [Balneolaceae bacterium]
MIIYSIIRNELTQQIRDKVIVSLGLLILLLLTVSVVSGINYYSEMADQHHQAEELARVQWENQGAKNPHSAAHYGTFAFKPVTAMSVFDPGVDRYTGVSIFLEGHRQNFAAYSLAEDKEASRRFAELTPAFIFAYLFPLFIILAGYRSVVGEKENGMYRYLKSQGVSTGQLIAGKTMGLWAVILLIYLPFLLIGCLFLLLTDSLGSNLTGFSLMVAVWLVYFGVIAHITIIVSTLAKSSGSSMVILLSVWIISTLLVPRLITNIASGIYPVPDTTQFYQAVRTDLLEGIDGHNPYSEHSVAFRDSVLTAHGVDDVADLPFNFRGMMLQEGEEFEKRIYDHHFAKIDEIHRSQIRLFSFSSILSPSIAARMTSMAAAGTDMHSFNHFSRKAEAYRIELMRELNLDLKIHAVGERAAGYAVGGEFFAQNLSFTYERPDQVFIDSSKIPPLIILLFWFGASAGILSVVARKEEVL